MTTGEDATRKRGERLKGYRIRAGLTQKAVAEGMEPPLTSQAVSLWETGESNPGLANLGQLDELLNAGGEIVELYTGDGAEFTKQLAAVNHRVDLLEQLLEQVSLEALGRPIVRPHAAEE